MSFLVSHPVTFAVIATIVIFGAFIGGMLVYFTIDEQNRRKAYATKESFDSLRYARVSDTIPDNAIPSLVQTRNYRKV